ncbi:hypothetical protein PMIT1342_01854 [Prochlorococcus marinus str. MIT 1342]|uniref:FkbM family methyltransferase n=1 Tax=Prochlorococcus TaxID=1218 RepID=UPI0007BAF1D7|nr:FkbM family methyltransferase [Prochlorococcus marinus]KZR79909.1 hypothetical protein PMIT1342_01854 [Prochlorococcus marinus str. MIT 1342]
MPNVLHVGASSGEIYYYANLGVSKLVYSEPDISCLDTLNKNISDYTSRNISQPMEILVIPKACSSQSDQSLNFYANGGGQSSLVQPGSRTIEFVGDNFIEYHVSTISLFDLTLLTFKHSIIDYLCIDTQGFEREILCSTPIDFLSHHFKVIDVELMTDTLQYSVSKDNWKHVTLHLLKAGFEPIIHPQGITESYLFFNSKCNFTYIKPHLKILRDKFSRTVLPKDIPNDLRTLTPSLLTSLGDRQFLPFSHIGGSIHPTHLQEFRELFVSYYLKHLSSEISIN